MKETTTLHDIEADFGGLKEAAARVAELRRSAERELELARRLKAEARQSQPEAGYDAASEARQLALRTRLANQRDIEELIRKASDEIQKILADIRVIRISAQEKLAADKPAPTAPLK